MVIKSNIHTQLFIKRTFIQFELKSTLCQIRVLSIEDTVQQGQQQPCFKEKAPNLSFLVQPLLRVQCVTMASTFQFCLEIMMPYIQVYAN